MASKAPEAPAIARLAIMVREAMLEPTARAASKAWAGLGAPAVALRAVEVGAPPAAVGAGAGSDRYKGLQLCHSKVGEQVL